MIFTFYSFKGGVGRSMAVANIAELMYRQGLRVVVIDWDLEAPGLENFFFKSEEAEKIRARPGLIDLLLMYQRQFASIPLPQIGAGESGAVKAEAATGAESEDTEHEQHVLAEYLLPIASVLQPLRALPDGEDLSRGALWFLSSGSRAGEQFASYARSVQNFDWAGFYENYRGEAFFEWLRRSLDSSTTGVADVVLIDARTGVTEMGGICTRQLADVVVALSAPNYQNLSGTIAMAESFRLPQVLKRRGRDLKVMMVPTRVENSELDARTAFQHRFTTAVETFIPAEFRRVNETFWNVRIPYIPKYAYEEDLVIGIPGSEDLENAYRRLATDLALFAPEGTAIRDRYASELTRVYGVIAPRVMVAYAGDSAKELAKAVAGSLDAAGIVIVLNDLASGTAPVQAPPSGIEYCVAVISSSEDAAALEGRLQSMRRFGIAIVPVYPDGIAESPSAAAWVTMLRTFLYPSEQEPLAEFVRRARVVAPIPNMAPPVPERYVERVELMAQDPEKRSDGAQPGELETLTTVICGPAGGGKSVMVAAMCRAREMEDIPDGILWIDVDRAGVDPDAIALVHTVLTREQRRFSNAKEAAAVLASDLIGRRCAVVVDGVRDTETLALLQQATAGQWLIAVTRNFQLVGGSSFLRVGAMQRSEAVAMLSDHPTLSDEEKSRASTLAETCGDWPLLLSVARAMVRHRTSRGDSVSSAMKRVTAAIAAGELTDETASTASLTAPVRTAIATSLEGLDDAERERFDALAVFKPPTNIPIASLAALVGVSEDEAERTATRLADASIVDLNLQTKRVSVYPVMALRLADTLRRMDLDHLRDASTRLQQAANTAGDPAILPASLKDTIAERRQEEIVTSTLSVAAYEEQRSRRRLTFVAAVVGSAIVAFATTFGALHFLRPGPSPTPVASALPSAVPALDPIALQTSSFKSGQTRVDLTDFVINPQRVRIHVVDVRTLGFSTDSLLPSAQATPSSDASGGSRLTPVLATVWDRVKPTPAMVVNGGGHHVKIKGGTALAHDGLLVVDGHAVSSTSSVPYPQEALFCVTRAGEVIIDVSSVYKLGICEQAIQSGPLVVERGGKLAMHVHTVPAARTVIALDVAGRLHVIETRSDLYVLGDFLRKPVSAGGLGIVAAMNLGAPGQAGAIARIGDIVFRAGADQAEISSALTIDRAE